MNKRGLDYFTSEISQQLDALFALEWGLHSHNQKEDDPILDGIVVGLSNAREKIQAILKEMIPAEGS